MQLNYFIRMAALVLCLISPGVFAEAHLKIDYDADTDIVGLSASGISLGEVLSQLASELDFKMELKSDDSDRLIHFNMQGRTLVVLNRLLRQNNVIIMQDGLSPSRVTRVILLPVGEQSREQRIRTSIEPPLLTDNEEDNAHRIADFERRVERRLLGLGRRKP